MSSSPVNIEQNWLFLLSSLALVSCVVTTLDDESATEGGDTTGSAPGDDDDDAQPGEDDDDDDASTSGGPDTGTEGDSESGTAGSVADVCVTYGSAIEVCYEVEGYGAGAQEFCEYIFDEFTSAGPACVAALEDVYACLSDLPCDPLVAGLGCDAERDAATETCMFDETGSTGSEEEGESSGGGTFGGSDDGSMSAGG